MRFYTKQHRHYCGIDLHARSLYVCILDQTGQVLVHQNLRASPEELLAAVAPYRDDLVLAVECIFTWYWVADLCAQEGIAFVLGHALYMKAIHGGKAKNDRIDALKIATLLRGGMLPQAYVYPAGMRATRDLLRRRLHIVRKRGQLLAHIQMTSHQYNLPPLGKRIAYPSNREGVAEHFEDRVVRKSIAVDLALLERYDALVIDLESYRVRQAKQHDPQAFALLRSIPGIGKVLALTILYEIHDVRRFDRVQQFASYARLVKCAKESAGKRHGTSGAKMGNVHLKWAFSEAAIGFVRHSEQGKKLLARLEKRFGKGKALSILAHKLGRAAYYILLRGKVFEIERFAATAS
jgi:transposase